MLTINGDKGPLLLLLCYDYYNWFHDYNLENDSCFVPNII